MSRRIYAKKSLGQNFLVDKQIKTKIINNLYLNKDDKIIEVGPGKGALTEMIYEKVSSLLAIELDDNLYLNLSSKYESENVNIIKADAKLFKIEDYLDNKEKYKFVGNLPYNVANKIILNFLQSLPKPEFMIVMLQLEVAKRIIGDEKFRGYLTIMIGIFCKSEILFQVKSTAFKPKPKVTSAVLKLIPYEKPKINISDINKFSDFVGKSFISRRKTILNNIASGHKISKNEAVKILNQSKINLNLRPQNLSVDDWVKLYFIYKK